MIYTIPNIITLIRIPLSLSLLLVVHDNSVFIVLYLLCGLSDVLDGYLARKMNLQSRLGAKLDSISDFIMYVVIIVVSCLWDYFAVVHFIPFLAFITLVRGINIGLIYIKFHQLGVVHTIGNKIIGFLAYLIPFIYIFTGSFSFLCFVLSVATIMSLEETVVILRMKKLDLDRKGLFFS